MIDHLDIKLRLLIFVSPFCLGLLSLAIDIQIACSRQYASMTKSLSRSKCLSYSVVLWGEKLYARDFWLFSWSLAPLHSPSPASAEAYWMLETTINYPET